MTEVETLAKLDILLTLLQLQKEAIDFNKIMEIDSSFRGKWLKMALYKLEEDKYAYELVNESDKNIRLWSITIEGSIFRGYIAKSLTDAADAERQYLEIARLRVVDENSEMNQRRLNHLTLWLAVGTIALALWQIFLYFYPVHKDYPFWFWQTIPKK